MKKLPDRLERQIEYCPTSGCWLWIAASARGYGRVDVNGKLSQAHRVVYEILRGPIPDGLQLDHLCRVRCCVNPDHLEPVTLAENVRRGIYLTTICKRGHKWTPENTYIVPQTGARQCRTCRLKRGARNSAAYFRRNQAACNERNRERQRIRLSDPDARARHNTLQREARREKKA